MRRFDPDTVPEVTKCKINFCMLVLLNVSIYLLGRDSGATLECKKSFSNSPLVVLQVCISI